MKQTFSRMRHRVENSQLSLMGFLGVCLLAATVIVGIGQFMYVTSAEYKLDLTRPDLKDINKDSLVEVDSTASYDSSSPLNRAAMEQEIKSIQGRQQELDRFGTFADQELRNDINNLLQGNGAAGQN